MTIREIPDVPFLVEEIIPEVGFINLNKPEQAEITIIAWAHDISVNKNLSPEARVVGRLIKAMAPGFCKAILEENQRDTRQGEVLNSILNAAAFFTGIVLEGCVKPGMEQIAIDRLAIGFSRCLKERIFHEASTRKLSERQGNANHKAGNSSG